MSRLMLRANHKTKKTENKTTSRRTGTLLINFAVADIVHPTIHFSLVKCKRAAKRKKVQAFASSSANYKKICWLH